MNIVISVMIYGDGSSKTINDSANITLPNTLNSYDATFAVGELAKELAISTISIAQKQYEADKSEAAK